MEHNQPTNTPVLRQVLMVAYLYPPIDNPGTRRVIKFVKYLPEFGYQPLILTTGMRGALPDDAATRTYRANDLLSGIYRAYRAIRWRKASAMPVAQQANMRLLAPTNPLAQWRERLLLPDTEIPWLLPAIWRGRQLLRAQPIKAIYSTSSPETDHLVALQLKRATGLPWVADFRDGWMFEPLRPIRLRPGLRRWIELDLERQVVLAADRVITVNDVIATDLARRYPQAAAKIAVITNGYDAADFAGLQRQRPVVGDKLRIVHTGALSLSQPGRSIGGLIEALRAIDIANQPAARQIEVVLVGKLAEAEIEVIRTSGMEAMFTLAGAVSYQQALQHQVDADILLLVIVPGTNAVSTSKLYEYLATGKPILALSGPSPAAQIITDLNAGTVVAPDDVAAIQCTIASLYEQWRCGHLTPQPNPRVRQFDRYELTRQLATHFDSLIKG